MSTLPYLPPILQAVLRDVPQQHERSSGFVQRTSKLAGPAFVQGLTFGWLANPDATEENLAQMMLTFGTTITAQGLEQRFTEGAAKLLQVTLEAAVAQVVQSEPAVIALLQRFAGVFVVDSTQIALPADLAEQWPGCGGGHGPQDGLAALKLQIRWNLAQGTLAGPFLQAGRTPDRTSPTQSLALPPGALRVADLGFLDLQVLQDLTDQHSYWVTRWKAGLRLRDAAGQPLDLVSWLPRQGQSTVDCPVQVGVEARLPARLIAVQVPSAVARVRRKSLRKEARRKGQAVSAERLALAGWTIVLTNVPADKLSVTEVLVVLRLRWQIELLFKLWKSQGHLDESRSEKPWRRICEIYAKLLGLLVQHWITLTTGWSDPARSLVKLGQTIRAHARQLAQAFAEGPAALDRVLDLVRRAIAVGCRINKRRRHPNAFQLAIDPELLELA
jgi:hypothetical protein